MPKLAKSVLALAREQPRLGKLIKSIELNYKWYFHDGESPGERYYLQIAIKSKSGDKKPYSVKNLSASPEVITKDLSKLKSYLKHEAKSLLSYLKKQGYNPDKPADASKTEVYGFYQKDTSLEKRLF